jgi:hypothetical protein
MATFKTAYYKFMHRPIDLDQSDLEAEDRLRARIGSYAG